MFRTHPFVYDTEGNHMCYCFMGYIDITHKKMQPKIRDLAQRINEEM